MNDAPSDGIVVPCLRGHACTFVFEEPPDDPEVQAALATLLDPRSTLLAEAEPWVVAYCRDIVARYEADDEQPPMTLEQASDVWSHVEFGTEFVVSRRARGDDEDGIYFSLECSCDWEPEHGLQLVVRDGRTVSKVGAFDGHLTNADAYGERSFADVVYVSIESSGG